MSGKLRRYFLRGILCIGIFLFYFLSASLFSAVRVYPQESFYMITEQEMSELTTLTQTMSEELTLSKSETKLALNELKASKRELEALKAGYGDLTKLSGELRQEDYITLTKQAEQLREAELQKQVIEEKYKKLFMGLVACGIGFVVSVVLSLVKSYIKR